MTLDRRDFITLSGGAMGSALLRELLTPPAAAATAAAAAERWDKAPCRFCGTGCSVQVGVAGGKVVAVRGDAESRVNRGLLLRPERRSLRAGPRAPGAGRACGIPRRADAHRPSGTPRRAGARRRRGADGRGAGVRRAA